MQSTRPHAIAAPSTHAQCLKARYVLRPSSYACALHRSRFPNRLLCIFNMCSTQTCGHPAYMWIHLCTHSTHIHSNYRCNKVPTRRCCVLHVATTTLLSTDLQAPSLHGNYTSRDVGFRERGREARETGRGARERGREPS